MFRWSPLLCCLILTGCTAHPARNDCTVTSPKEALLATQEQAILPARVSEDELSQLLRTEPLCRIGLQSVTQEQSSDGNAVLHISYSICPDELKYQKQLLAQYAAEWSANVISDPPSERVLTAYTRVCAACCYDGSGAEPDSAYGALIVQKAVCGGYAEAFLLLCRAAEIPCMIVTGTAQGIMHEWNLVALDGQWYHVDCCWDDIRQDHGCFLRSDAEMASERDWDRASYPAADGEAYRYEQIAAAISMHG